MTNEELIKKVSQEYQDKKAELSKDIKDWDYYTLYVMYELKEWLETIVNDLPEERAELIEFLKTKKNPLGYMFSLIFDYEDSLWDIFLEVIEGDMREEKRCNN